MSIAQSGIPFGINYTSYDQLSSLFVRASIYDITSGSPSFVANVNLTHASAGSYNGIYTGTAGKVYAVVSAVYTDGTYSTLDPNRSPATDPVQCLDFAVQGSGSLTSAVNNLLAIMNSLAGTLGCTMQASAQANPTISASVVKMVDLIC